MGQGPSSENKMNLFRRVQRIVTSGKQKDVTDDKTVLCQWVSRVLRYSTQYDSYNYCADQVIGPTKVYPEYGIHGAWAPNIVDQHQFLELEFEVPVYVTGIEIYETYHAGGVKAVKGRTPTGEWQTMWKVGRVENLTQSRIFSPPLSELDFRTRHIRLDIDCSVCGTWVEIDAVRLKGKTSLTASPSSLDGLASDLGQIVNDKTFSDVQFLLDSKTVYGHKAILCARSDYFRAMFCSQMRESASGSVIKVVDVDYDSFFAVLHFIYTDNIPGKYDTVKLTGLWRAADKFNMEGLKAFTTSLICEKIDESNVVDTYVASTNALPVIEEVQNNCMTFMSFNMSKIVNTKSFTTLPQEIMLEIVQGATAKLNL